MTLTRRFKDGDDDRRGYDRVLDAVRLVVNKVGDDDPESGNIVSISPDSPADGPTHKVSLSGSGIAFAHNKLLQPGDRIDLQLTLFPSSKLFDLRGMVISVGDSSGPVSGGEYAARAIFLKMNAAVRSEIVEHIDFVRSKL